MRMREWLIVRSGGYWLAVATEHVGGLRRVLAGESLPALAALLGESSGGDEDRALLLRRPAGALPVGVGGAELRADLQLLPLPPLVQGLTHPAITGLVLDQCDAVPAVDPAQLPDL